MTTNENNHPTSVYATHGVPVGIYDIIDDQLPTDALEKMQRTITIASLVGAALGLAALAAVPVRRSGLKATLLPTSLLLGSLVSGYVAGSEAGWRRRNRIAAVYYSQPLIQGVPSS